MYVKEPSMIVKRYSQLASVILGICQFFKSSNILVECFARNIPHIPENQTKRKTGLIIILFNWHSVN